MCGRLDEKGIPFVIYTGYTHINGPCRAGEQMRKPVHPDALVAAVVHVLKNARAGGEQ